MDPFDRFEFRRRKINVHAIIAFLVALVAAFIIHVLFFQRTPLRAGLFELLIVIAVGGLWYHIRRVV